MYVLMYTAQFHFDGISLFIEEDVGTHTYILLKVIQCIHSHVFIMIMMKCDKGHEFVICGILLHQRTFIGAQFSMLKISLPEVLLCSFLLCENFETWSYAQWFFACSTPNTSTSLWNPFCMYIRP